MIRDTQVLKTDDEQIRVKFRGQTFELDDNRSLVTIRYEVDDSPDLEEEDNPDLLVNILGVDGSIHVGDEEGGLFVHVKFDTQKVGWTIKCTRISRVSGLIFPHEIDIDLDKMEILVRFDVYS